MHRYSNLAVSVVDHANGFLNGGNNGSSSIYFYQLNYNSDSLYRKI